MGGIICLAFIISILFLVTLKDIYAYKIRPLFGCVFLVCVYASSLLILVDKDLLFFPPVLAYVIAVSNYMLAFFLLIIDAYQSNISKETLWWRFQYYKLPEYVSMISLDLKSTIKFWQIFWRVNSQKFRWHILWEFPTMGVLNSYYLVILKFLFNYLGNTYIIYSIIIYSIIAAILTQSFKPLLLLMVPLICLPLLCKSNKFQDHINNTYEKKYLPLISWNIFRNILDKTGKKGLIKGTIVIGGVIFGVELHNRYNNFNHNCVRDQLSKDNQADRDEVDIAHQRGDKTVVNPKVRLVPPYQRQSITGFINSNVDIFGDHIFGKGKDK